MTKTHAENAPSDGLTAWRKAFFTKDAKAFAEGFVENVVLEASILRKPVEGRDRVRQMLWTSAVSLSIPRRMSVHERQSS